MSALMFDSIAMWMYDHPWGVVGVVGALAAGVFALAMLVPFDDA